jgi:hypothetical protein
MYNGLKKRKTFEELIEDLQNFDKLIKYPNRKAKAKPKELNPLLIFFFISIWRVRFLRYYNKCIILAR